MANFYSRYKNQLLILLTLLLAGAYIGLLLDHAVNVPKNYDDTFICLEEYGLYLDQEISLGEYLTNRKNNHQTVVQRLLVFVHHSITGKVNFKWLTFWANIGYVLFAFWFIWVHRKNSLAIMLPILLLVPVASYLTWFSAASAYAYSFIFFYIIAYILPRNLSWWRFGIILLLLPILTATFGNSIVCLALLYIWVAYLLAMKKMSRGQGLIFYLVSIFCLILYFWGFKKFGTSNYNLIDITPFAFGFSGSMVKYLSPNVTSHYAAASAILLFLPFFIRLFKNIKCHETMLSFLCTLFVFGSGLAAASGRCPSAFCNPLNDRYELFGVIFLVFVILLYGKHYRYLSYPLVGLVIFLSINKYKQNIPKLGEIKYISTSTMAEAYFSGVFNIQLKRVKWRKKNEDGIKAAISRGLYENDYIPALSLSQDYLTNCDLLTPTDLSIKKIYHRDVFSFIKGAGCHDPHSDYYIKSNEGCQPITLKVKPLKNDAGRFYAIIPKTQLNEIQLFKIPHDD